MPFRLSLKIALLFICRHRVKAAWRGGELALEPEVLSRHWLSLPMGKFLSPTPAPEPVSLEELWQGVDETTCAKGQVWGLVCNVSLLILYESVAALGVVPWYLLISPQQELYLHRCLVMENRSEERGLVGSRVVGGQGLSLMDKTPAQ